MIQFKVIDKASTSLMQSASRTQSLITQSIAMFGPILWSSVRQHASGRPGPNVITGDYRNSITLDITGNTAEVYTDEDYGADLEYGHGTKGGKKVSAFLHFRPASLETEPKFVDYLKSRIKEI